MVGLVFYFFFGQDLRRKRFISRRTYKRIMLYSLPTHVRRSETPIPEPYQPIATMLGNVAHATPFYGSRLTFYGNGAEKMKALLEAIEEARDHIHILYYIICDDETGRTLQQALIRKAQQGVKVRLMYDDVGCSGVKKAFFQQMRDAGIEVYPFLEVRFAMFTDKVNYRNHRKIAVIDGKVGFIGGMNIADRYVKGPAWGGLWRDNHFKIEGKGGLRTPVSLSARLVDRRIDASRYDGALPRTGDYTESTLQVVTSGPFGQWRSFMQAEMVAIANAKRSICIQTPYFLPTEGLNTLLQTAALGGIQVQLMLPKRSDSRLVEKAMHSFIDDMCARASGSSSTRGDSSMPSCSSSTTTLR